jgi:hypothetical protein
MQLRALNGFDRLAAQRPPLSEDSGRLDRRPFNFLVLSDDVKRSTKGGFGALPGFQPEPGPGEPLGGAM